MPTEVQEYLSLRLDGYSRSFYYTVLLEILSGYPSKPFAFIYVDVFHIDYLLYKDGTLIETFCNKYLSVMTSSVFVLSKISFFRKEIIP
jgi:hypothetical protein